MLCAVTIPKKNQDQVTTKNRKIWTYLFDNLELRVNINPVYIYKYYITTQNKWTKWSVNSLLRIRWGSWFKSYKLTWLSSPYQFFSFNDDCGSSVIDSARVIRNVEGNQSNCIDILSLTVLPSYCCDAIVYQWFMHSVTEFSVSVKLTCKL